MTIENPEKTTAIGKVPTSKREAIKWLVQLSDELNSKKIAYDVAIKATAETFNILAADLKAGIKARQDENANEVVEKLNTKIDVIQEIAGV